MPSNRIDVLTPVWNGGPFVRQSIESLQRQTCRNIRIIVVDNGSTDDTPKILAELAARDDRIVVITQPHQALVDAHNTLLAAASAELISFQDADDIAEPDRLRKQADYLADHPDCVGVSGTARHIDVDGRPTGHIVRFRPPDDSDPMWVPAREPNLMPFALLRRPAVEAAGGFRHVFHADDTDLYWRLLRLGRLYNLPDVIGSYRVHAGSDTASSMLTTRISGMTNQLAAISAARAGQGIDDIVFDRSRYEAYKAAGSMQGIYETACSDLTRQEADHLRMAYAARVLQFLEFRKHIPDLGDCRFIRDAFARRPALNPTNERELRRLLTILAARLFRKGTVHEVANLLPPHFYPEALARTALRRF